MNNKPTSRPQALPKALPHGLTRQENTTRIPGDMAMWLLIAMELTVFALFFIGFAVMKRIEPQMFAKGQSLIHLSIGLLCTLSLLMSSYLLALALVNAKQGHNIRVSHLLRGALLFAFIYLVAKIWEYALLINAGFNLSTNDFFTLYFLITAFHFMHVVLGCLILVYLHQQSRKQRYGPNEYRGFEAAAAYWHMLDLLWILVFFLIYIVH
jgi:nitric oxide reductase NorE protein